MTKGPSEAVPQAARGGAGAGHGSAGRPAGGEWRACTPEEGWRSRSLSRRGRGPLCSFATGPQHSGGKRAPLPRPRAGACFPGPELATCSLIVTLREIVPPGDSLDICEVSLSMAVTGALQALSGWGPGMLVCHSTTQRRMPRSPLSCAGPCQTHMSVNSLIKLLTGLSTESQKSASRGQHVASAPNTSNAMGERGAAHTGNTVWHVGSAPSTQSRQ